jgi:hypothetical protein
MPRKDRSCLGDVGGVSARRALHLSGPGVTPLAEREWPR